MSLRKQQCAFARLVPRLIDQAFKLGFEVTLGDAYRDPRAFGMIGVTPPASSATVHVIEGGLSAPYLREFCRAHEGAGFDLVLVGYTSASAEGFGVATYASQHTTRLGFLIAHRPGLVSPSLAAREIAR